MSIPSSQGLTKSTSKSADLFILSRFLKFITFGCLLPQVALSSLLNNSASLPNFVFWFVRCVSKALWLENRLIKFLFSKVLVAFCEWFFFLTRFLTLKWSVVIKKCKVFFFILKTSRFSRSILDCINRGKHPNRIQIKIWRKTGKIQCPIKRFVNYIFEN